MMSRYTVEPVYSGYCLRQPHLYYGHTGGPICADPVQNDMLKMVPVPGWLVTQASLSPHPPWRKAGPRDYRVTTIDSSDDTRLSRTATAWYRD